MHLQLEYATYRKHLAPRSNERMSTVALFSPFGLHIDLKSKPQLLIGFLLDYLAQEFNDADRVDFVDIAIAAYELGFDEVSPVLELEPDFLLNLDKNPA